MRLLVVICHFFGPKLDGHEPTIFSSQLDPLARIAAVNASMVALHRHFGPRRHGSDPFARLPDDHTAERVLDIVVLQVADCDLLDAIGIDRSCYSVEFFDGPPLMLCFEAQRVLRERVGGYDYYAVIEDDIVIHDPLFFDKLVSFEQCFGIGPLLLPTRYEMAQSGVPAMVVADPILSDDALKPFRRAGQMDQLVAEWHGCKQSFARPRNPHASGYFVSDSQLRHWIGTPWFLDRDASWISPIESAMTLSIGRAFDLYKPTAPDPFFLSVEHYGTRYAGAKAPPGATYGDSPLLEIAHESLRRAEAIRDSACGERPQSRQFGALLAKSFASFNALVRERDAILHELLALKRSRSQLFRALLAAVLRKGPRW